MDLERLNIIYSKEDLKKIHDLHVLIVGIGGVGGSALNAIVRMGVNNVTIIDGDKYTSHNMNRQIFAFNSTIGTFKVEAVKKAILDINPEININTIPLNLTAENMAILGQYDYIIDACDTVTTKILLIKYAIDNNIKIITCLGSANRLDPTKVTISTLNQTSGDPLAKVVRKLCKDNNLDLNIPCVYSTELPVKTNTTTLGSNYFVPNTSGLYAAYYCINDCLTKGNN